MPRYEIVREIFNQCSGNQMRDVSVQELDVESIDAYLQHFRTGAHVEEQRTVDADGTVTVDLTVDGLAQRFSFTEA